MTSKASTTVEIKKKTSFFSPGVAGGKKLVVPPECVYYYCIMIHVRNTLSLFWYELALTGVGTPILLLHLFIIVYQVSDKLGTQQIFFIFTLPSVTYYVYK